MPRRSPGTPAPDCRHPDGCQRPQLDSAGWCRMHSLRIRRHGAPGTVGAHRLHTDAPCLVSSCHRDSYKNGWCNAHHLRNRRHGHPEAGQRMRQVDPQQHCDHPGCSNGHHVRGFCKTHSKVLYPGDRADLSGADVAGRWSMWAGSCYICQDPAQATDHVKPKAAGGLNVGANFRPICTRCNSIKRDEWLGMDRLPELVAWVRARSAELQVAA